ncbi:hypothetical protein D1B31_08940 [Neobacillus notoginsengisoli]|uniref:Sodium:proton antiporter n=1 Tax=Neobacillus notoginsengisoli TaxID=1578198 RepID=A0A417YUT7_9BACI|nr:hypothetical protein [Neobacillus notoginsengisoli]RHW41063.1 hypothetical protein D1B31_08940 [Neobacillus notoginsengisoli]
MSRAISSILMIGTAGYAIYRYRYRLMNLILGTGWIRKMAVSTIMGMPGTKKKLMESVFGSPNR